MTPWTDSPQSRNSNPDGVLTPPILCSGTLGLLGPNCGLPAAQIELAIAGDRLAPWLANGLNWPCDPPVDDSERDIDTKGWDDPIGWLLFARGGDVGRDGEPEPSRGEPSGVWSKPEVDQGKGDGGPEACEDQRELDGGSGAVDAGS